MGTSFLSAPPKPLGKRATRAGGVQRRGCHLRSFGGYIACAVEPGLHPRRWASSVEGSLERQKQPSEIGFASGGAIIRRVGRWVSPDPAQRERGAGRGWAQSLAPSPRQQEYPTRGPEPPAPRRWPPLRRRNRPAADRTARRGPPRFLAGWAWRGRRPQADRKST